MGENLQCTYAKIGSSFAKSRPLLSIFPFADWKMEKEASFPHTDVCNGITRRWRTKEDFYFRFLPSKDTWVEREMHGEKINFLRIARDIETKGEKNLTSFWY